VSYPGPTTAQTCKRAIPLPDSLNTLPIRRLGLAPGESADVSVAYFDGYELQPWPEPQRYTRFEEGDGGGMYRFVSLEGGFTADLAVDSDGLVVDYPRLFKRVLD
jgi:hypothetical protein